MQNNVETMQLLLLFHSKWTSWSTIVPLIYSSDAFYAQEAPQPPQIFNEDSQIPFLME